MPGRNGTGPLGMGPMTGRAAGYCAGYAQPGNTNYAPGGCFGWGRGNQRGGGRGRGWGFISQTGYPNPTPANESYRITSLEQQAKYLEDSLESIHREINNLKTRQGTD